MNPTVVLDFVNLFCAGLLAGAEFSTRYGAGHAPTAVPDESTQIQLRQALVRSLRVLVPAIYFPPLLSGLAVTFLTGGNPGFGVRVVGVLDLLVWIAITLIGTVPINQAALTWKPTAPPENWRTLVRRWVRLETARSWAAVTAFALFLAATAIQ